jgi:hypothetical protein
MQARYNEIASIVARHTTSSSPNTFRRLVHSSSVDQRGPTNTSHSSSLMITSAANNTRQVKHIRNRRQHNQDENHSHGSSMSSSISDDDYDDYVETDGSDHRARPIEPILNIVNVGPSVGSTINQPFQIRSSVHIEHRLGPMTVHPSPSTVNNRVASCAVCSIL